MSAQNKWLPKLKTILIISLALNIIAVYFIAKRFYYSQPPVISKKITYWRNRDELFEKLPKGTNDIIFLGTSLTQHFEFAELFQNLNVRNRGIVGDNTIGVLNRLSPIIADKPKKIFIEIGINDLGQAISKDSVLKNYKKIIDTLVISCPTTKLYVQSILPVANKSELLSTFCTPQVNADIRYINDKLKQYAIQRGVTYVDIYSSFVLNGEINPLYVIDDGVHVTGEAYLLWAKLLKPYVDN